MERSAGGLWTLPYPPGGAWGGGGGAGRRGWSFIFLSVVEVLGMRPETLELKSVQGRVRL